MKNIRDMTPEDLAQAWAAASDGIECAIPMERPEVRLIYLAHPLSGDVPGNLARAKKWLRWMRIAYPGAATIAPWIQEIEVLGDDDADPEKREAALRRDELIASRCDAIVLVGGRLSPGMARELRAVRAVGGYVIDLLSLGPEPTEAASTNQEANQ